MVVELAVAEAGNEQRVEENTGAAAEDERAQIESIVRENLGINYRDIKFVGEGAQSFIFRAKWGPEGERERTIKVDKINLASARARRLAKSGYTTRNHVNTLARLPEPEEHHIIGLVDYCDLTKQHEITISVHPYIEGRTLESVISEQGALGFDEVREIFPQILQGMKHYIDNGQLHRDLNPSNLLISDKGGEKQAHIIDFVNAGEKQQLKEKVLPTAGNRWVMDPLCVSNLTGVERAYGDDSEFYAFGHDLYFALTGERVTELNPDLGTFRDVSTRESLLNEQGKINYIKCEETLENALARLPKKARKLGRVIRRCLTLNELERYGSIDDLVRDFKTETQPGFWSLVREDIRNPGPTTAILVGGVCLLLGAFGWHYNHQQQKAKQLAAAVQQAGKYEVGARWNGDGLEVSNNLVKMDVRVSSKSDEDKLFFTKPLSLDGQISERFVSSKPGDTLFVTVYSKQIARPEQSLYSACPSSLEGKIYFEGFPGEKFYINPLVHDEASIYWLDFTGSEYGSAFRITNVPKSIEDGTHILAVELYAPENSKVDKHVRFTNPGKIISRKRIPVVIGEPKDKVDLRTVKFDFPLAIGIGNVDNFISRINPDLEYELSVPEENFKVDLRKKEFNSNLFYDHTDLPRGNCMDERTLQVVAKDGKKIVGYTFVPIKRDFKIHEDFCNWNFSLPGKDFSERLIEYRKRIYENSQGSDITSK